MRTFMLPAVVLGKTAVSTLPTSAQGVGDGIGVEEGVADGSTSTIVGMGVSVAASKGVGGGGSVTAAALVGKGAVGAAQATKMRGMKLKNQTNQPFTDDP